MNITPIKALKDNYIWLIHHQHQAICIDPGDASPVLEYLQKNKLTLTQIWITHHHYDHIDGVTTLQHHFPDVQTYANKDISTLLESIHIVDIKTALSFAEHSAHVQLTAGHTEHHLSFILNASDGLHVFCGDTLFSAGCGRVFTGTIEQLFNSFQYYKMLPEHTLFYPAHEYTKANLHFAAHIEPNNTNIQIALTALSSLPSVPVTLAHERKINPFLRCHLPHISERIFELTGIYPTDDLATFSALRTLKNQF